MTKEFLTKVNLKGNRITDLGTPEAAADAATKQYVDDNSGTEILQQPSSPSSPVVGDLWLDTDEGAGVGLSSILAHAQVTANQTGIGATEVDLNGLSVTVTVPAGRRLKVTAWAGPGLSSTVTGDKAYMVLTNGANGFLAYDEKLVNSNHAIAYTAVAIVSPTAGSHTFKMRAGRSGGTGIVTLTTSTSNPAFILVEDITGTLWPAGAPINGSMLGANTVTSTELQDNSVGTGELQSNAVSSVKIQDNAITQSKMADNSVGTAEIINGNVTTAKLESSVQTTLSRAIESAQTGLEIQSGTIVANPDGNGVITVFYATPFPAAPQAVVLTNGEDGQGVIILSMLARTTHWFTMRVRDHAGNAVGGGLFRVNWFASNA